MMECIAPPALSDEALSLALDGLADEGIKQHLAVCPFCKNRLEAIQRLDISLVRRLRRFDCPSVQRLTDYHAGLLNAADMAAIRAHVESCPRCQAELEALTRFLDLSLEESVEPEDSEEPEMPTQPTNIIPMPLPKTKRHTRTTEIKISGNLALRLRGETSDDQKAHDQAAGSARIFLESRAIPTGFLLTGQIIDAVVDWRGAIIELWQDAVLQQVHILDEMCEFSFELASSAPATLHITAANGTPLLVEDLRFNK